MTIPSQPEHGPTPRSLHFASLSSSRQEEWELQKPFSSQMARQHRQLLLNGSQELSWLSCESPVIFGSCEATRLMRLTQCLFSSFQLLSSCEYNNARPRYLDLLFCYDCLGRSGTSIREPRPSSSTLESPRRLSSDRAELQPIATGYRLLVSVAFAAFGLAKMFCGYLGFSSAMYTLDWIIAIPLTLG